MTTTTVSLKLPDIPNRSTLAKTTFPQQKRMNKEYNKRNHSYCCEWKSKLQPNANNLRRAKSAKTAEENSKAKRILQDREKLLAKMERKEQLRLERLKYAAENGKIKITTNGLFETKACKDCDRHHKIASIKIEKSQRKNCFRPSILSRSPSPAANSEGQLQDKDLSEMSFEDHIPSSPIISFRDSDVCDTSSELELFKLETEKLQTQYYREMLNQEESALRARVQYENKLLEKARKKHRHLQVKQVQQELAEKKRVDQAKLKLEALIKRRIALEAINETLKLEEEKQRKLEILEEEILQEKLNIHKTVQSNIAEQLPNVYRKTPYPRMSKFDSSCNSDFSLQKPISSTSSKACPKSTRKSVQIEDDVSIITKSSIGTSCLRFIDICDSSHKSGILTDAKTSSNASSVKGVVRTNSLRHMFTESSIKESSTDDEDQSSSSEIKSVPVIPIGENQQNYVEETKDEMTETTEDQPTSESSKRIIKTSKELLTAKSGNEITQTIENQPDIESIEKSEVTKTIENPPDIEIIENIEITETIETQPDIESIEITETIENQPDIESIEKIEITETIETQPDIENIEITETIENQPDIEIIEKIEITETIETQPDIENIEITETMENQPDIESIEITKFLEEQLSSEKDERTDITEDQSSTMSSDKEQTSQIEVTEAIDDVSEKLTSEVQQKISKSVQFKEDIHVHVISEDLSSKCSVSDEQTVDSNSVIESSASVTIEVNEAPSTDSKDVETHHSSEFSIEINKCNSEGDVSQKSSDVLVSEKQECIGENDVEEKVETLVDSCKKVYNEEQSVESNDVLSSDVEVTDEQATTVIVAAKPASILVDEAIESKSPSFAEQLHSALLSATLSISDKVSKDEVNDLSTDLCEISESNTNEVIVQELERETDQQLVPDNEIQITESDLKTTARAIVRTAISKVAESLEKEVQEEINKRSKSLAHEALENALTGLCLEWQDSLTDNQATLMCDSVTE